MIARIDSLIGKFSTPTNPNTLFRGSLVCYGEESIGTLQFEKLWHKAADSSVNFFCCCSMQFNKLRLRLFVCTGTRI